MPRTTITAATIASLLLAGAGSAPAQNPVLDPWEAIAAVTYEERGGDADWRVLKGFPDGYGAPLERFRIEGFAVIYAAQADLREVLLVPDRSQCPFCGGGEGYGPTLSVSFARPIAIPAPGERIAVEGRLVPVTDVGTYEAFRLEDARLVAPGA